MIKETKLILKLLNRINFFLYKEKFIICENCTKGNKNSNEFQECLGNACKAMFCLECLKLKLKKCRRCGLEYNETDSLSIAEDSSFDNL